MSKLEDRAVTLSARAHDLKLALQAKEFDEALATAKEVKVRAGNILEALEMAREMLPVAAPPAPVAKPKRHRRKNPESLAAYCRSLIKDMRLGDCVTVPPPSHMPHAVGAVLQKGVSSQGSVLFGNGNMRTSLRDDGGVDIWRLAKAKGGSLL